MYEDTSGYCDSFLNCDSASRTVSSAELANLDDQVAGDESLGFKRGPSIWGETDDERSLITAAWNLLLANLDLVVWAVCKTTGSVSTTEFGRLLDRINGKTFARVTVHVTSMPGTFMALYGTDTIWVSRKGEFANYLETWMYGTHPERLCAALDLAATLLHELTHLAGYTLFDFSKSKCYTAYMVDNAFRWGIAHRYPEASAAGSCCENIREDYIYGCGDPAYPDFDDCSSSGMAGDNKRGFFEWLWDTGVFLVEGIRWLGRAAIGLIWRGLKEGGKFVLDLLERGWEAAKAGGKFVLDLLESGWEAAEDAGEKVVEKGKDVWNWFKGLFDGGGGGGGGGCCGCACNPCYDYCPSLFNNDCFCTPKVDADSEAMTACQSRCSEGMMEEWEAPAEFETPMGG